MPPCPIDDAGRFTSEVPDFAGQYVKVSLLYDFVYAGLYNRHSSPGCRQGNYESAQGEGPTRETGPGKTSVSILLEVGMMTRVWMISRSDRRIHRSNTPIIYRAFPVWNVRVSHIVDDLVKNNGETRWFVTVLVHKCPNSPKFPFSPLFAGCHRTLVRIDSETGSPTHATGLFPGTAIGAPRMNFRRMFLLNYFYYSQSHP